MPDSREEKASAPDGGAGGSSRVLGPASGGDHAGASEPGWLAALFDAMPQLGWSARADGYIDYYNRGWYEYTGATPEQMEGWAWESVHDPELLPGIKAAWTQAIAGGRPFESTFPLRRHDGVFRWFLTRANPLRDSDGRIFRWVGVNTDVDDARRAEQTAAVESRRSDAEGRRRLEDTLRIRENVLAMVSHDLRNPLNSILLAAKQIQMLSGQSELGLRIKKPTGLILKAVDRMTRLVGDLLDLSRLEAGKPLQIDLERLDLANLTREAVEQLEPMARAKRLTLTNDMTASIDMVCDGERVQQLLSNLIGNALKFTREGGTISVRSRAVGSEVVVSVSDTGTGIAAAQIPHLFEPYWQADPERKGGTGLGLSITRAIVEAHRGRIWVESTLGVGSTFYVSLPMEADRVAPQENR